jgi:hypothetical protein
MSQDDKANVLYNRHLHPSIKEGNKELEDAKRNYPAMKSLLLEKSATSTWKASRRLLCLLTPGTRPGC